MRKMFIGLTFATCALACSPAKPTNFKPSMQEGAMTDGKNTVPEKTTITYPNGTQLLERKDGTIRILDKDGELIDQGTIIERKKNGTINFKGADGMPAYIDKSGFVGLVPVQIQTTLPPRPNIR